MNKPLSEKEKVLTMLTDIYDQLEELESILEASFSDQRSRLNKEEQDKITIPNEKLFMVENKMDKMNGMGNEILHEVNPTKVSKSLKLEMGF